MKCVIRPAHCFGEVSGGRKAESEAPPSRSFPQKSSPVVPAFRGSTAPTCRGRLDFLFYSYNEHRERSWPFPYQIVASCLVCRCSGYAYVDLTL